MNDYKELIENLRMAGRWIKHADGSEETYLLSVNDCVEIADAIEQLVKERDEQNNYIAELHEEAANLIEELDSERNSFELVTKLHQLKKERDEWKTLGELANKRAEDYREMHRQCGQLLPQLLSKMGQKRKLISLLTNFLVDDTKHSLPPAKNWIEEFADYLIQNGGVVLPEYRLLDGLQKEIIQTLVSDMSRNNAYVNK